MRLTLENGTLRAVESYAEARPCVKGRAYRHRLYDDARLLHPLKRVGARGSGEFSRISWDEALATTAAEINRVRQEYGPESLLYLYSIGDVTWLHNAGLMENLLARSGGYTGTWGSASGEGAVFAAMTSYGMPATSHHRSDLLNSRLILLWGWNPAVSVGFDSTNAWLSQARAAGTPIVCIDPRYTDSAAVHATEWVPIRPGTDSAVLIAMAYVVISNNLVPQDYVKKHVSGYDEYKKYVTGETDGLPKTPEWASAISGVPAATIHRLATAYAAQRPAALLDSFAPGRTDYGEQFHRAAIALAAITGNIGVSGGHAPGSGTLGDGYPRLDLGRYASYRLPQTANPVDAAVGPRPNAGYYLRTGEMFYWGGPSAARLNRFAVADAILKGRAGGYPADYKMAYLVNFNYLNQYGNTNKIRRALEQLEFVVVQEQVMTATARYADIILPTSTFLERRDLTNGGVGGFAGITEPAVTPRGEAISHFEIAARLAPALGVTDFSELSADEWVARIAADNPDFTKTIPPKSQTGDVTETAAPFICFQAQIENPAQSPFPTPSGKIEIYSAEIAAMNQPGLPPIPQYFPGREGPADDLRAEYPLQMVTTHTKRRAHTQFETVDWLRELYPHQITMHVADAAKRGIRDGDTVAVYNRRGRIIIRVCLTERILPGTVDLPQGAWYQPNAAGDDLGGCANVLTSDLTSPAGTFTSNLTLVEVTKA